MSRYKTQLVVLALVVINTLGICLTTVNTVRYKATRYHYFSRQRFAWLVSATTSYNGGNIGQLVPDTNYYAQSSPYAIREFNRFSPHTAEFITDLTQLLVNSLN